MLCGGQGQWPDIFVAALISVQYLYTPSLTQTTTKGRYQTVLDTS